MRLTKKTLRQRRDGAVLVLLVVLLPVLILLSAMAINFAQVELTYTELQIATDVATRAGGTAWTATGDIGAAVRTTQFAAGLNTVQNDPLVLQEDDIIFGNSVRPDLGRFVFEAADPQPDPEASRFNANLITSIQVKGSTDTGLFFQVGEISNLAQTAVAVTSQVDRDICLVVDRSGSMVYFEDEQFLFNVFTTMYNNGNNEFNISGQDYIDAVNDFQGPINPGGDVPETDIAQLLADNGYANNRRTLPSLSLSNRFYTESVLDGLDALISSTNDPSVEEKLRDLATYSASFSRDYNPTSGPRTGAPEQSRWSVLEQAMESFVDVLDASRLLERVSVTSFDRTASLDLRLALDVSLASERIEQIIPTGSTAIGVGMIVANTHLVAERRLNAIPTLLVFSDGENRRGINPVTAAEQIKGDFPFVVINTVTFADGDQTQMAEVARIGGGVHRHANDGDELQQIFEEIASSFSTVITE